MTAREKCCRLTLFIPSRKICRMHVHAYSREGLRTLHDADSLQYGRSSEVDIRQDKTKGTLGEISFFENRRKKKEVNKESKEDSAECSNRPFTKRQAAVFVVLLFLFVVVVVVDAFFIFSSKIKTFSFNRYSTSRLIVHH